MKEQKVRERHEYLRSPETCIEEKIRTVPPEALTESTKLTYLFLVATSEFLRIAETEVVFSVRWRFRGAIDDYGFQKTSL